MSKKPMMGTPVATPTSLAATTPIGVGNELGEVYEDLNF